MKKKYDFLRENVYNGTIKIMEVIMENLKFTENHEWVRVEGDIAYIGISDYAQNAMGDVVFVELPELESSSEKGESFATVESVKAVSDIYSPVSGEVVEINETLEDEPGLVNDSPYENGWICAIKLSDISELDQLMSNEDYTKFIEN